MPAHMRCTSSSVVTSPSSRPMGVRRLFIGATLALDVATYVPVRGRDAPLGSGELAPALHGDLVERMALHIAQHPRDPLGRSEFRQRLVEHRELEAGLGARIGTR